MADLEKGPGEDEMSWQHCGTEDHRHSLDGKAAATTTQSHLASSTYHINRTPQFPEGGTKAYLAVLGAFLAMFCTFGQLNAFGTYQTWYAEHQLSHLEPATIAWIGSMQLWVFFFSGGPIGQLFDAYGPRWIMAGGSVLYVFAIMMTSISTQYYQYLLAHGIVFGLGVGMLFYPSMSSVSTYFSKYRATALGIVASGSSFGGVVYPIMLQRLFETVGFAWGVRISGLVTAAVCCIAVATVTRYAPPKQRGATWKLLDTFKDARFVLLAAGSSFVALGLFIPFFFIVDYARDLSISAHYTFIVLAVMNAGGVIGRVAPNILSDRIGRFNLLVPASFLSGLLCVCFWLFARSLVPLMLFAAAYGFSSGAFISVITPCVAQISDIRQIGSRIGLLYSIISFPSLVGGPAAGALLEAGKGQYTGMILFAGLTVIAGSFLILAAKLKIDSRLFARV
ncbi:major facilitator superfamily domain-containing protein [Mycena filopes]|nr:major facilitator superfamily domain-containing protein [Mycena filopes]